MKEKALIDLVGGAFCGQRFIGLLSQGDLKIDEIDLISGRRFIHVYRLTRKTASPDKNKIPMYTFTYDAPKSRELKP